MIFSHAHFLIIDTKDGVFKQARLVYDAQNGQSVRAFPTGKEAPEDAASAEWDADTLTITYTLGDDSTTQVTLTEQEIEDAKNTEAL